MSEVVETIEQFEILFAAEGRAGHHSARVQPGITVREFVDIAVTATGVNELIEVFLEDTENPLQDDLVLVEQLSVGFAPLHIASRGKIKTTVRYERKDIERTFGPAITISTITAWSSGKDGFNLQGEPSDFQLKLDGKVLAPDDHLGQIAHGKKEITLDLVFKVKPQG